MYFSTCNHYDILFHETNNDDICLICWDPSTNNNVIKMQSLIPTTCNCNGLFHHNCLFKWINAANSCPICRTVINHSVKILHEHNNYNSQLFNKVKYITIFLSKIFKFIFLIWFMNMTYNIIFHIQ